MKKTVLITTLTFNFLLLTFNSLAQPAIQWEYTYGGTNADGASSVLQTLDGGYIVVGGTTSNDGDVTLNKGGTDCWAVKLDANGNMQWEKTYGGTGNESISSILQTTDGGYIFSASTLSNDGDISNSYIDWDYWIVKIDSLGVIEWEKSYGGTSVDIARDMKQTIDKGYIIVGYTESNNGLVSINKGGRDYWIIKIDSIGSLEWEKSYGGSGSDMPFSLIQTVDNGFLVLGQSNSIDGDISNNIGNYDFWVVKTDSIGNIQWEKNYGGTGRERGLACALGINGGYILAGRTYSNDGDVSNHFGSTLRTDYWVVKIDSVGNMEWENSYGGTQSDEAVEVLPYNGGYVVLGDINSSNGMISTFYGDTALTSPNYWLIQIDTIGNLVWEKNYGGSFGDWSQGMIIGNNNNIVMTGATNSTDYDVLNNDGGQDFWVVKLNAVVGVEEVKNSDGVLVYPNPSTGIFNLNTNAEVRYVEVVNLLGNSVLKKVIKSKQTVIDLKQHAKGIYFIKLFIDNKVVTKKIIYQP